MLTKILKKLAKISMISQQHNITVRVESPFDNLFGSIDDKTNIT